ncbi:disease resistance At4g27190-like [Olea europaea subsp. europaea]|uniref:Disease resistance At4g27190-like n=1 Tax=Olea europaea subsp. europaea TaxID=158383 RepID=A0A8S0S743_OLEEU|nr:disease resistance At4g27190-like [Olea europaea subsp. europaea]
MALEMIVSVVGKLIEYTIDPLLCQFKYMFCYKRKIQTLMDKVKALETKEFEVQELVHKAKNNVEVLKPVVVDWLQNVDEIKKKANEVFNGATNFDIQCLFLRCPNLKTRYLLGRKATKKTAEVAKLQEEGTLFQKVGEPKPLVQIPYQNPGDFGVFETRISTKKKIMDALKDKNVSIIGICGMGGVGKTTMAKEIANEAKVDKLFDEFAWADVSQVPNVIKIQDQLAENLDLKIKDITDKYVRAERFRERLGSDRSKSILVKLDDVWEDIVLETLGFPSAGDDKRLKILLTSRDKDVCKRMKAQRIFDVNILNEKESWELFKEKAEISDDLTNDIKGTAEEVTMECGGLPLTLVTVGRALNKKSEHVWKMHLKNYEILVWPISEECKNHEISTDEMVRYAWGLELFKDTTTLITTRYKVNSIVDNLKSCYLLLSADIECVRLHDVVRDVCLQIASKDKHAYIGLKEWPRRDNNELYNAISLTSNELNQIPSGLEYPNLKFLLVICNQQSLNTSKEFFADMKELRVLDFTGLKLRVIDFTAMRIQIPSSIQLLTKLRTLCLDHCALNIEISTIGKLKKLEILSLYGSTLDHFPNDISELSNLRLLDLRLKHSSGYCPLSPGILLQLKKLEELYLGFIEIRDDELEQRGYIIKEISLLTGLNTFQISTHDPAFLLQILHVLCIEKLERFHIVLADLEHASKTIFKNYYFRRRLDMSGISDPSMLSLPAISSLIRITNHLSIEMDTNNLDDHSLQVMEMKNMVDEDGFEYLNGNFQRGAFNRLQEIYLLGIPKMKHLWSGVIKPPSLHNLMILVIGKCPSVKSLFVESVALCMVNLQSLRIHDCEMLEEIVSMNTEQNEVTQMLEFPKLQEIILHNLRNFESFRSESNKMSQPINLNYQILINSIELKPNLELSALNQLTSLDMRSLPKLVHITRMFPKEICIFENLTELRVAKCDNLRYLFSPSIANKLVALNFLRVWRCEAIEEIIGRQEEDDTSNIEIAEEGMTSRIVFPKLSDLRLYHLDRFKTIFSQNYELVFPSLEHLLIINCPAMAKLSSRQQLSAPKLHKVQIEGEKYVDISNFLDAEGSVQI